MPFPDGVVREFRYFHDGIDMADSEGEVVRWEEAQAGTIQYVRHDPNNIGNGYIVITIGSGMGGWLYGHTKGFANDAGTPWTPGKVIQPGEKIGEIGHHPNFSHVHLDWIQWSSGLWRVIGNPLEHLTPTTESTAPTVEDVLFCSATSTIFISPAMNGGKVVLFGNIDVVAKAYDQSSLFGDRLGIYQIGLAVFRPDGSSVGGIHFVSLGTSRIYLDCRM